MARSLGKPCAKAGVGYSTLARKEIEDGDFSRLLATRLPLHVEIDRDGRMKYRSPDKDTAREQLMKHLGLFEKDNAHKPDVEVHVPGAKVFLPPIPKTRKA